VVHLRDHNGRTGVEDAARQDLTSTVVLVRTPNWTRRK
jgi:hypothetical protein